MHPVPIENPIDFAILIDLILIEYILILHIVIVSNSHLSCRKSFDITHRECTFQLQLLNFRLEEAFSQWPNDFFGRLAEIGIRWIDGSDQNLQRFLLVFWTDTISTTSFRTV